jgi:hypothetical protein
MNSKQDIESLLQKISDLYDDATNDTKEQELYSKIALLELCGWLEVTLDEIVKNYALNAESSKLTNPNNVKYLEETIIGKTYGFKYNENFKPILIRTIGIIGFEKLEKKCEADLQSLKSVFGTIQTKRDEAAHTSTAGVMRSYDSPSIIKGKLNQIYPLLEKIELELSGI